MGAPEDDAGKTARDGAGVADTVRGDSASDLGSARTEAATPNAPAGSAQPSRRLAREEPGRYRTLRELGRGGMGRVTLAVDETLGREVALKELLAPGASGDDGMSVGAVARFLREARVTGQLEHPAIVPVHEVGQRADGTLYYTMRRIRGRSLSEALRSAENVGARLKLLSAFRDVCQAVAYAHSRGVIHRDLKPDNVMVGEYGDTLVVDWGIAKVRGEEDPRAPKADIRVALSGGDGVQTVDGHAIGTPAYMSPEQARGDLAAIDERSDVWGLGAILFEILTGRPPFRGKNAVDVLRQVLEDAPPRVRSVAPDAPPELAAIADRALSRDPTERYLTAKELAEDVTAWQDGAQVGAYVYSWSERARRFVRRNRAATVAAAVVTLAVLGASGFVLNSYFAEHAARAVAEGAARAANTARRRAEESDERARDSLADALLEKADRALSDGDPHAAGIFAAATLVRSPTGEDVASQDREDRARSLYADAQEARHWTFEGVVENVSTDGAVSPDARQIVMPGEEGLTVVDVATGVRTRVHAARSDRVVCFVDATHVLVHGPPTGVVDVGTGTLVYPTDPPSDAAAAAGKLLVAGSDGNVQLRDAATGAVLDELQSGLRGPLRVALAPNASRFAVWTRDAPRVDVYDLPRTAPPRSYPLGLGPSQGAFSPDGRLLGLSVVGAAFRVVDTTGTGGVRTLPSENWAGAVVWPSNDVVGYTESYRIAFHDLATGARTESLHYAQTVGSDLALTASRVVQLPESDALQAAVFRRLDAQRRPPAVFERDVFSLGLDRPRRRVVIASGQTVSALAVGPSGFGARETLGDVPDAQGRVLDLVALHDGGVAIVTSLRAVLILSHGELRTVLPGTMQPAGIVLSGLAVDARTGIVYSTSSTSSDIVRVRLDGTLLAPLATRQTEASVLGLDVSRDGARLAAAYADGVVRLWDVGARPPVIVRRLEGHARLAADSEFSPDGRLLATADGVGTLRIFDAQSGELLRSRRVHGDWINRITWSEDSTLLATASDDGSVRVVSAATLRSSRIVRRSGTTLRAVLVNDGADVVAYDGTRVTIDRAVPATYSTPPDELLERAEHAAGMRLTGLALAPHVP